MVTLGLEIVFWLILLSYVSARISQPKKGFKNNIKVVSQKSWGKVQNNWIEVKRNKNRDQ